MNQRTGLLLSLFAALAALQLAVPASMILSRERTLREGAAYKFRTQPVDPYDAFRGRYVQLRLEPETVASGDAAAFKMNQKVFAILERDTNGFAHIVRLAADRPRDAASLPVIIGWTETKPGRTHIHWPLDRYYMDETRAPDAEKAYREHSRRNQQETYVSVRILGDQAVLEELYIAGRPVKKYLATGDAKTNRRP